MQNPLAVGNQNHPNCSACSFMQKQCPWNCPLAEYFPPEDAFYFTAVYMNTSNNEPMEILRQYHSQSMRRHMANIMAVAVVRRSHKPDDVQDILVETLLNHAESLDQADRRRSSVQFFRGIAAGVTVNSIDRDMIRLNRVVPFIQEWKRDTGKIRCLSSTQPGCSACRFMERTCPSNCPLAPHFPPDRKLVFDRVNILLHPLSAIEAICLHKKPLFRWTNAIDIAKKVAELGCFTNRALNLLAQSLYKQADIWDNEERRRLMKLGLRVVSYESIDPLFKAFIPLFREDLF